MEVDKGKRCIFRLDHGMCLNNSSTWTREDILDFDI